MRAFAKGILSKLKAICPCYTYEWDKFDRNERVVELSMDADPGNSKTFIRKRSCHLRRFMGPSPVSDALGDDEQAVDLCRCLNEFGCTMVETLMQSEEWIFALNPDYSPKP